MGQRFLIVDNDRPFLKEQQVSLEAAFETEVAQSPDGVIGKLESGQFAAVLICVEVADNKGYALCTAIRKNAALNDVKIAMISAKATEEEYRRHQSLKGRADLYLHKPIAPSALVAAMNPFVPMRSVDPDNPLGDLADSDLGDDWLDGLKSDIASEVEGPAPASNQTVAISMAMIQQHVMSPPSQSAANLAASDSKVYALEAQVSELESVVAAKDAELRRVQTEFDQLRHSHDSVTQNLDDLEKRQADAEVLKQRLADAEASLKKLEESPKEENADNLKHQLREAMGERTELLQQVEALNNQMAEKTTRVMTLLKEKDRFQQQSLDDQTKLEGMAAVEAERDVHKNKHEALGTQMQAMETTLQEVQAKASRLSEVEANLSQIRSEQGATQESLAQKITEHDQLVEAHADLQARHEEKAAAHAEAESNLKMVAGEVAALEVTVRGQGRELVELGKQIVAKDKEIETHQTTAAELTSQVETLREALSGKEEALQSLEATKQELHGHFEQAKGEWDQGAAQHESERVELQRVIADKESELKSHKTSLADLQDAHEGLSRDKQVLNGQLAERQERLQSLSAIMAEALEKLRKGADLAQG